MMSRYKTAKKGALDLYLRAYLIKPKKKYIFKVVSDPVSITGVFRLRHDVYCLRDKLLDARDYPEGIERDEFDEKAIHIAAYNRKGEIVGAVRLIKNSELGFPTEKEFHLEKRMSKVPHDKMAEISRFLTDSKERGNMLMLELSKALYLYSRDHGIEHWIGCAESWFINKLNFFFGPIDMMGEPQFSFNAMNYPFTLSVAATEKNVQEKSKAMFKYFSTKTKNFKF